ncbi:hypothetical protein F909_02866 [Acinetobacter sp. ANC 3929]|uniref:hypothetical protein n=1 Tax=Acinetobacter sp. ANC 3929 TaxID=1217707 RepID=UPI0002CDDAAD|nr:hypothetical protein [Acinetobacter sp. ANC 3929]ENW79763.1 hypothetical protein F909_02866 [Acinetobacter sp. ANC 3929]
MKDWFKTNLGLLLILIATVIYLYVVLSITDLSSYHALRLNEKGDLLAGIFSPLAFLWLVYGYLQQGSAIKLNNENISKQLDQQNEMLKLQIQERLEREHAVQPIFDFKATPSSHNNNEMLKIDLKIKNVGEKITAFQLFLGAPLSQQLTFKPFLNVEEEYTRQTLISREWINQFKDKVYVQLPVEILYKTSTGLHYKVVYVLNISTTETGLFYEMYSDYIKLN